jgi:hypothetical protein
LSQELIKIVVYARHSKIRLALEGPANVVSGGLIAVDFDQGENKILRLVEGGQNLVLRDRYGFRSRLRMTAGTCVIS